MTTEEAKALFQVIEPLLRHQRVILREKAQQLKQTDGEGWAVGEMLERACILLDAWGQHGGLPALASEPEPLAVVEGWMHKEAVGNFNLGPFRELTLRHYCPEGGSHTPVTVVITERPDA